MASTSMQLRGLGLTCKPSTGIRGLSCGQASVAKSSSRVELGYLVQKSSEFRRGNQSSKAYWIVSGRRRGRSLTSKAVEESFDVAVDEEQEQDLSPEDEHQKDMAETLRGSSSRQKRGRKSVRLATTLPKLAESPSKARGGRHVVYAQGAALRDQAEASVSVVSPSTPDLFLLDLASKIEDSLAEGDPSGNDVLARLREEATEATLGCRWPTNKDEQYRFTDLKFLKQANIVPVSSPSESAFDPDSLNLQESEGSRLIFIDGVLSKSLSSLENLPEGVIAGSISSIPQEAVRKYVLPRLSSVAERSQKDVFACLNGVGARDLAVVIVPAGVNVKKPLYVLYYSSSQGSSSVGSNESSYGLSNPRLVVVVGKESELNLVEDFSGVPDSLYWSNSVCEIEIDERGRVGHSYVQEQGRYAVHIRQTHVSQAEASSYKLVEAVFGGRLSRHNLYIQQLGPDTITEMSTFLLAGRNQLHDLHSKLVLDHPRGISRQLHKCIVSDSSGHGVFDGNVKVNRFAQQTDAGQLSRNLLLAPRATVNLKPNLQIIANDVKCSHGAAISDLEEEQLFYFRARGIDVKTARSALVFSFGAEVLQKLDGPGLRKRVENLVKNSLAEEGYINPELAVTI